MLRLSVLFFLSVCTIYSYAQIVVSGTVVDGDSGECLSGVSVVIRNAEGKIVKYVSTDANGEFALNVPFTQECRLDLSIIGYGKQSLALNDAKFPMIVKLTHEAFKLKEVAVKADRIREQGDTISYSVSSFAQQQDRSIGDVLRRMPGIDVQESGKIQYQGEDINKFYIEGSDLLGGKYGIATNGIRHDDVGAIEVLENHQPMQVLSGISFSDKAAINLKLKNKAKATWSFHGNVAGGYSWSPDGSVWDGEAFAMAVMPSFQDITTVKSNNIGEDLSVLATDFFADRRQTGLSRYVSISLPDVPSLSEKRTLFNRSFLVSTNNLWKLHGGEFKTQIDYAYNRVSADATNVTAYFLNDGDRIITENRSGIDRMHSLSGKFIYESNKKTAFINNTLQANIDWDDVNIGTFGSIVNSQYASLPDYYICNRFKMIKRFNGKHLVTFESRNEWESMPQKLSVEMSDYIMRQHVDDHAFYTHESAAYAFTVKGVTVSLEGGVKGYMRSMQTELPDMPTEISGDTYNVLNTDYFIMYVTPRFEYWIRRINFSVDAPVSFAGYSFDKAVADRSEVYFSPSMNFSWKPNNRFNISLRGGVGRSPMKLNLIQPGYIMTDYRSFHRGVDDFYNTSSQNVSANFSFKHTRKGLFANAVIMHSWSHTPYTMSQQLFGDYIVYSYASANNDSKSLIAFGNVGKTLDFMHGSMSVSGSYTRNESELLSENNFVSSVGTSWSVGAKINGKLIKWLGIDYSLEYSSARLALNDYGASWLSNTINRLLINVTPHNKWELNMIGEDYWNEVSADKFNNVVLFDTKLTFKMNKRIELSAILNNVFNRCSYNYTTYNQLSSFESQRRLRGRELLISISIKK